jgi:hypothetical protein
MDEKEVQQLLDLHDMARTRRWALYRYWVQLHRHRLAEHICALEKEFATCKLQLAAIQQLHDKQVLQRARVIGMTTTGAAKHQALLQVRVLGLASLLEPLSNFQMTLLFNPSLLPIYPIQMKNLTTEKAECSVTLKMMGGKIRLPLYCSYSTPLQLNGPRDVETVNRLLKNRKSNRTF